MELLTISKMAKFFLLITSFLIISCSNNSKSFNLIPRESFKSILIYIETSNIDFKKDTIHNLNKDSLLLESILIEHKVSGEMYEQTLMFYINNPEEMRIILQEIKDSLST